ncbi:glycosyltransferase [Chitinispirillales bacterium ANBcel5]|uniref:CgeB family protein n=1 Tax=Cellulosispirillum alkaliphilum TaxID=3039283 RepID=UPI002A52C3EB|nr:glycosyltransferase [Chitinispirillales bacterium ANBcel5]
MLSPDYDIVIMGLTITSSWGNGHATTYRGLMKELSARGHKVLFLERDMPWYACNRDTPELSHGKIELYSSIDELKQKYLSVIQKADLVIVGSFVPDGVVVGEWVNSVACGITAFYDIDTPVTMSKLKRREYDYIAPDLISKYDLYLSFAGGPILNIIENVYNSPIARPLYCSVDPEVNYHQKVDIKYDLGYMGTFSPDRQDSLEILMLQTARKWPEGKFIVAGPQYPKEIKWPANVKKVEHLAPADHRRFYCSQRYTLNLTRADMIASGYAPSVRLFEAAACAVPVISDYWEGLETFFKPNEEIIISGSMEQTYKTLLQIPHSQRMEIGQQAQKRVLQEHTSAHRAEELEYYVLEAHKVKRKKFMSKALFITSHLEEYYDRGD